MTRLLQISCVLTLVGLALMVWSMLVPTPMPVILAMSLGQLLGTVAFGMFGYVVLVDQLRKQRAKGAARAARELVREPTNEPTNQATNQATNDASDEASPRASS